LVEHVSPVQLTIRLLVPAGSRLLELPEARAAVGEFDEDALSYRWVHPDPRVDRLQRELEIDRCTRSHGQGGSAHDFPPRLGDDAPSHGRELGRARAACRMCRRAARA
jgi:hypothetical protein